jgi:hypothetical protein
MSEDLKDFLYSCLQVNDERRKSAEFLIHHPFFNDIKSQIDIKINNNQLFVSPINNDFFIKFTNQISEKEKEKEKERERDSNTNIKNLILNSNSNSYANATSDDNYEIINNILKIDIISYLKKQGIISYKPKILNIPQYFSLHFPESEDYSIGDFDSESKFSSHSFKKVKTKTAKNSELIYDKELNEKLFNEGSLILIGHSIINLPKNYEKEFSLLENFLSNDIIFSQGGKDNFSSIGMNYNNTNKNNDSLKSDSSSNQSKFNFRISNSEIKNSKATNNNNNNINNIEKEISNYFSIKSIVYKILYKIENFKREDLIVELKKTNYFIPNNLRFIIYSIILDVDFIVQTEEYDIGNCFENKEYIISEMLQIKKDIVRCEEYDLIFKTDEGKLYLKSLFENLLYNKEDFFYLQGMDSIAAAFIKLYYPKKEIYYQIFYKLIKKLTYNFLDIQNRQIKDLNFHHRIISRILAFLEPELYVYLDSIEFFDDLYATAWLITLFSSKLNMKKIKFIIN